MASYWPTADQNRSAPEYFPPLENPVNLRLAETRTFRSGVVLLRYERDL